MGAFKTNISEGVLLKLNSSVLISEGCTDEMKSSTVISKGYH